VDEHWEWKKQAGAFPDCTEVVVILTDDQRTDSLERMPTVQSELVDRGLVSALRGPRGGVSLARPPSGISFLDVIEAVEGPVVLNLCLDDAHGCSRTTTCSMQAVWRTGQERMLDVYRATSLASLAGGPQAPVQLGLGAERGERPAASA
jgi:Rrf2 family protein